MYTCHTQMNATPPPPQPGERPAIKPSRMSMVFPSVMVPGAGQWVQRRWFTGTAFIVAFMGFFIAGCYYAGKILYIYYNLWEIELPADTGTNIFVGLFIKMLFWFLMATVIWIANVVDANYGYRRRYRD